MRKIVHEKIGEEVYLEELDNGLQVAITPKPGYKKSTGIFATRYGSVDRVFKESNSGKRYQAPDGVAHFLEHKLFEGDQIKVFDLYAKLGAMCNAATSFRTTHYYFSTTGEFMPCLDILLNFVQNPVLTTERVEKEKGIIEQEVRMYQDNPDWRAFFNLLGALYKEHPIRIPIGGTVESVYAITLNDLLTCYNSFYRSENMLLVAAGDLDPQAIFETVRKGVQARPGKLAARIVSQEPAGVYQKRVADSMSLSRAKVFLGFRDFGVVKAGKPWLERELASELFLELLFGKSSPVFLDLYSRGIIDGSFSYSYTSEPDYGFSVVGGETNDPDRFETEILAAIQNAKQGGFAEKDFQRLRKKIFGMALRRYDSPEGAANSLLAELTHELEPFTSLTSIEDLSLQKVNQRFQEHCVEQAMAVSLITPSHAA